MEEEEVSKKKELESMSKHGGKRKRIELPCGGTICYYDSSSNRPRRPPIRVDIMLSLAQLAIRFYNMNELTDFGQVKVLKVDVSYIAVYDITFQASSPSAVASLFITKVYQTIDWEFSQYEIRSVRIQNSQQHQPQPQPLSQLIKKLSAGYLAPCLSQLALIMHNIFTLNQKKVAVHDISSLQVVKATKHVAEATTYLVTFEAPLRDKSKNVETFETQICLSALSLPTTIAFKKVQIKHK